MHYTAFHRYHEELQLKAYSPGTIRTYTNEFAQLPKKLKSYPVGSCSKDSNLTDA